MFNRTFRLDMIVKNLQYLCYHSDGSGARIRTWDRGSKDHCLTAWPHPNDVRKEDISPLMELAEVVEAQIPN